MMKRLTRRSILRRGGILAAIGLLSPLILGRGIDGDRSLALRFVALFSDRAGAAELGSRYLEVYSQSPDWRTILSTMISDHAATPTDFSGLSSSQLRKTVSAMMSEDFKRGDAVWLDGWLLSRTEVRLYALTKLVA